MEYKRRKKNVLWNVSIIFLIVISYSYSCPSNGQQQSTAIRKLYLHDFLFLFRYNRKIKSCSALFLLVIKMQVTYIYLACLCIDHVKENNLMLNRSNLNCILKPLIHTWAKKKNIKWLTYYEPIVVFCLNPIVYILVCQAIVFFLTFSKQT